MKQGIHPAYQEITFTCACGNTFQAGSTSKDNVRVEICAACHPLYTGKAKFIDTTGRMERFANRIAKTEEYKTKAKERKEVAK